MRGGIRAVAWVNPGLDHHTDHQLLPSPAVARIPTDEVEEPMPVEPEDCVTVIELECRVGHEAALIAHPVHHQHRVILVLELSKKASPLHNTPR